MSIYVITYDLRNKDSDNYEDLFKAIKALGSWWHCLDSNWLVVCDHSAVVIRNHLWQHMRNDDKLLVVKYAPPESAWAGFTGDCATWLKTNM